MSERITVDPDQCGGAPCVRGMRVRVSDIVDLYDAGQTPEQIGAELPYLDPADIEAALAYASDSR